jgi:hypothetical protein
MEFADLLDEFVYRQQSEKPIRTIEVSNSSRDDNLFAELDDFVKNITDENSDNLQLDGKSTNCLGLKNSIENIEQKNETPSEYSFPIIGDSNDKFETINLANIISDLVDTWEKYRDYMQIRDAYCTLSIAMNHLGMISPAYRAHPTINPVLSKRDENYRIIQKDRLIIECHWLRCRQESIVTRDKKYQALFDSNQLFPFELSEKFASENWSNNHRADEALYLTAQQQSQLIALQGNIVRERRARAMDGIKVDGVRVPPKVKVVRLALRKWSEKKSVIATQYQIYEALWLARELLDKDASMREIAKLGSLITGASPLDESTVRLKLAGLDKHILGYTKQ